MERKITSAVALTLALALASPLWSQLDTPQPSSAELDTNGRAALRSSGCAWGPTLQLDDMVIEDLAVDPWGTTFVVATSFVPDEPNQLVTFRGADSGWELVDVFAPPGHHQAGGHALHVTANGDVFALGWSISGETLHSFVRVSTSGGGEGSWSTHGQPWQWAQPGALASDHEGTVYVALGDATQAGWLVYRSFGGFEPWELDDAYQPEGEGVWSAMPRSLASQPDGTLWVAGLINGAPDRWVLRERAAPRLRLRSGPAAGEGARAYRGWRTVDTYALSDATTSSSPSAIATLAGDGLVVVGSGSDDTESWAEEWVTRRFDEGLGEWHTERFQLEPGRGAIASDATVTTTGEVVALGEASTAEGTVILLRRSLDAGETWSEEIVAGDAELRGSSRLAAGADGDAYLSYVTGSTSTVLSCR